MTKIYVKIALLAIIGMVYSTSVCMLQSAQTKFDKKATRKAAEVIRAINAQAKEIPLALPAQRPAMEGNFFTELPKDVRVFCTPSTKPNIDVSFQTRELDLCRHHMWLRLKINVSSTSRASRFVMLRDDAELAHYLRRANGGIRLLPNPTAAIRVAHERGLDDMAGVRFWGLDKAKTEYERSYQDSIERIKLWQAEYNASKERARYMEQSPLLTNCSIQ